MKALHSESQTAAPPSGVGLAEAGEARRLLADPVFIAAWESLYAACAWATPFQSPGFARVWFETYAQRFEPLFVTRHDGAGSLSGLLALARRRDDGMVVPAGTPQVLYQAWLAAPDDGVAFLHAAWRVLARQVPNETLTFRHLPPAMPALEALRRGAAGRAILAPAPQHRMIVDGEHVTASLAKKHNKKRLRRLQDRGEVRLRVLRDASELDAYLPEIIVHHDLRKGAAYGSFGFEEDPLKAEFHRRLAGECKQMHATVLTAGDALVSSVMGFVDRGVYYHAISSYSPFFASLSPTRVHWLLLKRELLAAGVHTVLPSPGDDEWKRQTADATDTVYELHLHRSLRRWAQRRVDRMARTAAKRLLTASGIDIARLRRSGAPQEDRARRPAVRWRLDPERGPAADGGQWVVGRNDLQALLRYAPAADRGVRRSFLARALAALERGESVYTVLDVEGRLVLYCRCAAPSRGAAEPEGGGGAPDATCAFELRDLEIFAAGREAEVLAACLRRIAQDALECSELTEPIRFSACDLAQADDGACARFGLVREHDGA